MTDLAKILIHPELTARRLKSQPHWVGSAIALMVLAVCAALWSHERHVQETIAHLPPSAEAAAREAVRQFLEEDFVAQLLFLPFRLLTGWSLFALILYVSARSLLQLKDIRYVHFLSLEVHAEAALLIGVCLTAAGLPLPSLALFIPAATHSLIGSLLASANLSTLWYVGVLTAGVSVLCTCSTRTAFLITAGIWGLVQAVNLGILNLLSERFHFTF